MRNRDVGIEVDRRKRVEKEKEKELCKFPQKRVNLFMLVEVVQNKTH